MVLESSDSTRNEMFFNTEDIRKAGAQIEDININTRGEEFKSGLNHPNSVLEKHFLATREKCSAF